MITKRQLDAECGRVQRELERLGLWRKLKKVDVFWCLIPEPTIPTAIGFFVHQGSRLGAFFGYKAGHIYIPAWTLSFGGSNSSLRDTLRHEYGHAFAHYFPKLIRSRRFAKVFGGSYHRCNGSASPVSDCVSAYAATQPCEDFAETFRCFLKHKGRLPKRLSSTAAVRRKWEFVANCFTLTL